MGGKAVLGPIATDYDLVDAVQAGLPVGAVDDLLARGERLTLEEADRLARSARVLAVAEGSFGSADKAGRWLRRPSRGLRGEVPLGLAVTTGGARLVEDELIRIASGDLA